MKRFFKYAIMISTLALQSCLSDLRNESVKTDPIEPEKVTKGKEILHEAWVSQGMDKLAEHKVYSFSATDTWQGMMGKMGKLWPNAQAKLEFKYAIGTFDSKVTYLDGDRQGVSAGLQSWNYYEIENGNTQFLDMNKRVRFGLSAFQYFTELADRLKQADVIVYGGREMKEGKTYDIVFVSWNTLQPHQEHDQYKLYINTESKVIDFASYTLRENYLKMPGGGLFYGTMKFKDWHTIDGIKIPFSQIVFLNDADEDESKNVHHLVIDEFQFDSFDKSELYPNNEIKILGDMKILP